VQREDVLFNIKKLFTSIFLSIDKINELCISFFSESSLSQKYNSAFMTTSIGLKYLAKTGFKRQKTKILCYMMF